MESARHILDVLNESVEAEESTGFDASGSGGTGLLPEGSGPYRDNATASGSLHTPPIWSNHTDDTSMSQTLSSLDLDNNEYSRSIENADGGEDRCYAGDFSDLDEQAKESLLCGMFPMLKSFDIKWAMTKHKGDLNHIIDELMTRSFLDQNGARQKGIEAFSESEISLPRKAKGKRKKNRQIDNIAGSPVPETHLQGGMWDQATKNIDFISSRSGIPSKQVRSLFHNNGGSLRATISAIIEAYRAMELDSDDPLIQSQAIDLGHEFPSIPLSSLVALVQIGHPSFVHSRELAKVLTTPEASGNPGIQLEFRRPPLQLDYSPAAPNQGPHTSYSSGMPLEAVTNIALKHIQTRDAAFSQARAAYRKGKSNSLMGGAAAYYSQEGRDADARAREAMSAAADKLVEMQSWREGVDLHGVSVEDARRIVREKITSWWHELEQSGQGIGAGYRIVTGVGNHSEGGVGKLGPAVGKMLIREGWKVQVGTGYLVVTGIAKK